jgi:hypothetical protein
MTWEIMNPGVQPYEEDWLMKVVMPDREAFKEW